jgi:hypothetical protein
MIQNIRSRPAINLGEAALKIAQNGGTVRLTLDQG